MAIVNQSVTNQPQPWIFLLWRGLRTPKLTIGVLVVLSVVVAWGLFVPQQLDNAPRLNAVLWRSSLPQLIQPWGEFLFSMGLAQVFQNLWFWFPVGLLFINSLVALADYSPGVWQRWQSPSPSIEWQHPLAIRSTETVTIQKDMDWNILKTTLAEHGLTVSENHEQADMLTVAKRAWAWLAISIIYVGLIILPVAFLGSYYYLEVDQITLSPADKQFNTLLDGQLELLSTNDTGEQGVTVYTSGQAEVEQTLDWSLYRPQFLNQVLVTVAAFDPVLTINVFDSSDKPVRLLPFQENLDPSERLNLPLGDSSQSLYFRIVSEGLTFQITPSREGEYNVQVLREGETTPFVNEAIQNNVPLSVDQLSVHVAMNHQAKILAYYDPFAILYLVSFVLTITGIVVLLFRSPLQFWFIMEQQDSYQWLHGAMEQFGKGEGSGLLNELLPLFASESQDKLT
ncbi:cytochrome c biogenesis protein ResB [Anaerolineales bacterium HSG24]|nr:cytochrome c biogenesis protein ResB [Anaerolineales bacterium HSG24]